MEGTGVMRASLALWLALAAPCAAQATKPEKLPRWRIDPYTRNDPQAMKELGYVSYGPFEFGCKGDQLVTTAEIDKHLSYDNILWVETAHFRIGSSLKEWVVPLEPEVRKKIRAELARLAPKMPPGRLEAKKGVLDSWLRLHMIAMRMEDLYAEISDWLCVKPEEFPKSRKEVIAGKGRFMGYGPYLGQDNKYLVLVTEKGATYNDYLKTYIGRSGGFGQRWNFKAANSLFFGTGADTEGPRLKDDTGLHCSLVFNVTHNLIDGFRFYSYDLPVWIKEGLAHWFERRVSTQHGDSFDQNEGNLADKKVIEKWDVYMRGMVANDKGSSLSTMMTWRDYGEIQFNDHVVCWSRIDFLLSMGKEKFSKFMFEIKGRVTPDWMPDHKDLVGAVRDALQKVYGLSPISFDEQWKAWVLKTYPTQ
jgi:hypothetical protein